MIGDLDDLLTALYVLADDFLPKRAKSRPGPKPRIADAEVICLAVAQILLDCPKERRFIRFAKRRLGHLIPYIPGQSGYNKRVRALAGEITALLGYLARISPSWCDGLRLIDATPVPCGQSRETVKRSEFAGHAAYGYCAAHSRHFWGFKLYLLCASDGMPIAFELAPANAPEREVVAEMLERVELAGYTVIGDKGLSGAEIEELVAALGGCFCAPTAATRRRGSATWAEFASGSRRSSTSSKTSSRSSATAPTRWRAFAPASPSGCSSSVRPSGTTGGSASPAAAWSPTTIEAGEWESVI